MYLARLVGHTKLYVCEVYTVDKKLSHVKEFGWRGEEDCDKRTTRIASAVITTKVCKSGEKEREEKRKRKKTYIYIYIYDVVRPMTDKSRTQGRMGTAPRWDKKGRRDNPTEQKTQNNLSKRWPVEAWKAKKDNNNNKNDLKKKGRKTKTIQTIYEYVARDSKKAKKKQENTKKTQKKGPKMKVRRLTSTTNTNTVKDY